MNNAAFNRFCQSLPAATHVVQWGDADVWKVGGKVFAIGSSDNGAAKFTFKAGDLSYEILKDQPGLRPAPYMASRGLKWIQHYAKPGLPDKDLKDYIRRSYDMVAQGLPKTLQAKLGIGAPG